MNALSLKQLAPGGHLGRFIIWTKSAFKHLDALFGKEGKDSTLKNGYHLNRPMLNNADIARIINSSKIQEAIRIKEKNNVIHEKVKKNPLKNKKAMEKLNPLSVTISKDKKAK